ncbi:MAG: hypothetical protein QM760_01315 [Nibricoccus sp.]
MKTTLISLLRATALVVTLAVLPSFALAKDKAVSDPAKQSLAQRGYLPVKAAGPYVDIGTFQIQVFAKLGRPAVKLADGTWLYPHFTVKDSNATGTLVVRFKEGCVSELTLVTEAIAAVLSAPPQATDADTRLTSIE